MAPPTTAELPDGTPVALLPLAEQVAAVHLGRHPEDVARYGPDLARQWCIHDFQHVLAWAVEDQDLEGQLAWLAGLLDARGYPVANLIDCTVRAAEVVEAAMPAPAGAEVAERLRAAAGSLRTPDA